MIGGIKLDQLIVNLLRRLVPDFGLTAIFGGPFIQDMIILCFIGFLANYILNVINAKKQNNIFGKRRDKVD